MFSLFDGGITETKCSRFIGFNDLIQKIRDNPNADKIALIRNLRKNGNEYYKVLKSELPNVTPSCIIKVRNLEDDQFKQNFLQFSNYLYFDIDKLNAEDYKSYFINRYGHLVSMVCLSSSGGGIAVLFKVKNALTKENFLLIWETVRDTILKDEIVDNNSKGIGRAMFISHDPSVYYSYENEIEVEIKNSEVEIEKTWGKQSKTCNDFINTLISPFSTKSIDEILEKIITRTIVPVSNPVVDYRSEEIVEFYIPKIIRDGTKHIIYTRMIHTLVYLNPSIEREYIYSYIFYINNRFAKPRMEKREFIRWFNMVYENLKTSGKTAVTRELRYIHFNPNCSLTKKEKNNIANMLNGYKRKNESIKKIQAAKNDLELMGQKITQNRIAELTGLSPKTIRAHLNSPMTDMDEIVTWVNNSVPIKSVPG